MPGGRDFLLRTAAGEYYVFLNAYVYKEHRNGNICQQGWKNFKKCIYGREKPDRRRPSAALYSPVPPHFAYKFSDFTLQNAYFAAL